MHPIQSKLLSDLFHVKGVKQSTTVYFCYSTLIDLLESNANHIIPSYCHLPVGCRSLVDWKERGIIKGKPSYDFKIFRLCAEQIRLSTIKCNELRNGNYYYYCFLSCGELCDHTSAFDAITGRTTFKPQVDLRFSIR